MEPRTLTMNAQLTAQDYVKAQFLHLRPRAVFKWVGVIIVLLAVIVFVFAAYRDLQEKRLSSAVMWMGIAGLYFTICYGFLLPWRSRRHFKQQKTLNASFKMTIDSEALRSESSFGTLHFKWKDFHKYKIGNNLILVYQSDLLFHMFPRRWFESEEDFRLFLFYLQQNLGTPKA